MPKITVTEFQTTPNPNALKCILSAPLPPEPGSRNPRSYSNSSDAQTDPLASKFFALSGVASVLILPGWVTVVKSPETSWATLKPKIEAILGAVESDSTGAAARIGTQTLVSEQIARKN